VPGPFGPAHNLMQVKRGHEPQTGRKKFRRRVTTVTALLRHPGLQKSPGNNGFDRPIMTRSATPCAVELWSWVATVCCHCDHDGSVSGLRAPKWPHREVAEGSVSRWVSLGIVGSGTILGWRNTHLTGRCLSPLLAIGQRGGLSYLGGGGG
jgi:hypothetical protein